MQVLITSYIRGEEDSTHLALTDRGREVVDTLTVMQLFFISHNMGKDSTSLDCKDTLLKASISNCLGRMKGQNITGDLGATEQKNNDDRGTHIQVGHGIEMEIEGCAVDLDGRDGENAQKLNRVFNDNVIGM